MLIILVEFSGGTPWSFACKEFAPGPQPGRPRLSRCLGSLDRRTCLCHILTARYLVHFPRRSRQRLTCPVFKGRSRPRVFRKTGRGSKMPRIGPRCTSGPAPDQSPRIGVSLTFRGSKGPPAAGGRAFSFDHRRHHVIGACSSILRRHRSKNSVAFRHETSLGLWSR